MRLTSALLLLALASPVLAETQRSLRRHEGRSHHRDSPSPPAPPSTDNPPVSVGGDAPPAADGSAAATTPADERAASPPVAADALTFSDLRWTSEEGQIRVNGQPFHIKGVAWFGMEDDGATLHGLDKKPMGQVLDFLTKQGFNALRLTVSLDFALRLEEPIPSYDYLRKLMDKDLWELKRGQLLSKVVDKAADKGFLVLLDMHRLSLYDQGELWYGLGYTEDDLVKGWDNLLSVVGGKWNVFGLDLKNEPRGRATWGTGDVETDWALAATRISQNIIKTHPEYHGLFFVEGVENPTGTWQTSTGRWWGGDIEGIKENPIQLGTDDDNKRVVYAPHIYGPGQYMMDYFLQSDFPTNLPTVFEGQWGFAENLTGRAVVIGEWGGNVGQRGTVVGEWASALVSYLVSSCIADTFFWSLNPDSMDTGGLLKADWSSVDADKLSLLARLQPHPSRLTPSGPIASTTTTTAATTATKDAAAAAAAVAAAAAERSSEVMGSSSGSGGLTFTLTPGSDGNPLCARPPARA